MDRASYFIDNKCLFGSYPSKESVSELEKNNVKYFVDLTLASEKKIIPYKTNYTYISYPIHDHQIPANKITFAKFIMKLVNIIKNNCSSTNKMYIHCKGGHGRAGIVVSVLLSYINQISPEDALKLTAIYHSKRKTLKEKWKKVGSPQTSQQKNFVYHFCKPIYFFNITKNETDNISMLSNFSKCEIKMNHGTFMSAEAAIQSFKALHDNDYITKQINSKSGRLSKLMGDRIKPPCDWENNKRDIVYKVLKIKFTTNEAAKSVLLDTQLCKIINKTDDTYWGVNFHNNGLNMLGKILYEIREELLLSN